MKFPIFKTKIKGADKKFDLNNPKERKDYFELKAGKEIEKLKNYFKKGNTFIAYFLGPKNSGKGTYSKLFAEIIGPEMIEHFSVGDMMREIDKELSNPQKKKDFIEFLKRNYRGWHSTNELVAILKKRSTKTLLPTDLILTLIKREIEKRGRKTLFVDGFPRDLDQINFSLFFRDLIGYRDDLDVFILINVPKKVIDERMKGRLICPLCQTSRNIRLLPTSKVNYDKNKKEFYLICDNPQCPKERMRPKEGDELGIKPIKKRLKKDEELMKQAISLYGIPKIFLRNSIPKSAAKDYIDDYEITPEYSYEWDEKEKRVNIKEKPWIIKDDDGIPSYSLLAPPVVISLIRQLVDTLRL